MGLKIKHPQTWNSPDINNPTTGEKVTFISPKQTEADKFQEKVTVSVQDFSGRLEEFSNLSIKEINNNMSKAKIVSLSETFIAKKPGKELVFTGINGENSLRNLQVFTLKGDKAYVIIYTAEKDSYEKFLPTAETMIKSFEIQ